MSRGNKIFWLVALLFGLAIAIGLFSGCASGPSGVAPVDDVILVADTNGINGQVVSTNLSVGIVITFTSDMTAELQSALGAAGIRVVNPRLIVVEAVDGTEYQRTWIAAALAAGGEAEPFVKVEGRNPKAERRPKSEGRNPNVLLP